MRSSTASAIYRHPLPVEARGAAAYFVEYPIALFWEFVLALKVWRRHGFDVIHACNPPDLIFLIGLFFKIFAGKSFVFDHHDANPEFYEAKFGRRGFLWQLLRLAEKLTFKAADISIATNESYRRIAIERGGMRPERVFVVRSGPNLDRVRSASRRSGLAQRPRVPRRLCRRDQPSRKASICCSLRSATSSMHRGRRRHSVRGGRQRPGTGSRSSELARTWRSRITSPSPAGSTTPSSSTMLSTADVCVNPDRVTAMNDISTMNKIMEYMALGKPIVQFDVKEGRVSAQERIALRQGQRSGGFRREDLGAHRRSGAAPADGRVWPRARGRHACLAP